jgi:hypothetical protein
MEWQKFGVERRFWAGERMLGTQIQTVNLRHVADFSACQLTSDKKHAGGKRVEGAAGNIASNIAIRRDGDTIGAVFMARKEVPREWVPRASPLAFLFCSRV